MRPPARGRRFYAPLRDAAQNAVEAATLCAELYDRYPEAGDRLARIEQAEEAGDQLIATLSRELHGTFVTPLDREDLLALAAALDDVCDHIEEAAARLDLYRIRAVPEGSRAQARILLLACERLADAIDRLPGLPSFHTELEDVYALEEQADRVRRDALARLFAGGAEPLDIVRAKGLYDCLEQAVNATKSAARVLEGIAVKSR
jgi:uncharacterized protein Yka (UPF0111/DUF47 family)